MINQHHMMYIMQPHRQINRVADKFPVFDSPGDAHAVKIAIADVVAQPLVEVALKSKILEEKETAAPIAGQLYFLLEGKHKPKQIELIVKTSAGPLSIRFKQ